MTNFFKVMICAKHSGSSSVLIYENIDENPKHMIQSIYKVYSLQNDKDSIYEKEICEIDKVLSRTVASLLCWVEPIAFFPSSNHNNSDVQAFCRLFIDYCEERQKALWEIEMYAETKIGWRLVQELITIDELIEVYQ